jgi:hypothetical protein
VTVGGQASRQHLLRRLAAVEARVRSAVTRRRAEDPEIDDPVRGLYISEEQVDRLLAGAQPFEPVDVSRLVDDAAAFADEAEATGADLRLRRLARTLHLDEVDVDLLLIAAAPDIDPRFERLYGYLHDDVTRRRASVGLALELMGLSPVDPAARARLTQGGALAGGGLVEIGEPDRPLLSRPLRVPERAVAHLLGGDTPSPAVAGAEMAVPVVPLPGSTEVGRAVAGGVHLVYLRDGPRDAGMATAVSGLHAAGWPALAIDLGPLTSDDDPAALLTEALLEAGLRGAGLIAGPIDTIVERGPQALVWAGGAAVPVALFGRRGWDPAWLPAMPATVTAGALDHAAREQMWQAIVDSPAGFDPAAATVQYRLKPEQAVRAWQAARRHAVAAGRPLAPDDLRLGARLQNAGRLDHLARRITPRAGFADLVLRPQAMALLREIAHRARHREHVIDSWQMGGRSDKGRGITALFAGESGTGKTLSAEVIAHDLGLDLYVIDLSTVVDKYIGETEKNLERIFDQAEDVNGILFFDEADALFGKRSEVSDARDRYANVEIAYLLQRMERFDGITVLATNLRANIDEAFTRRIDVLVDFPEPEEDDRRRLWELHLPPSLPCEEALDLDYLAKAFELSGGDIRNITLAAAYAAAVEARPVSTAHLLLATAREYRKLGRLVTESEFGPYFDLVTDPAGADGSVPVRATAVTPADARSSAVAASGGEDART